MRVAYLPTAGPRDFGVNVSRTRKLLIGLLTPLQSRIGNGSVGYLNTGHDEGWI